MARSYPLPSAKAGLPPGSLVHVGAQPSAASHINLLRISGVTCQEEEVTNLAEILAHRGNHEMLWVQCEGMDIVALVEAIGSELQVHPLVLEDILNTHQRPKFEEFDDHLFFVAKTLRSTSTLKVEHEQISMLVFSDMVFTFRERSDDLFHGIKLRLDNPKSRLRFLGSDYLAYTSLDLVVDHYFTLADSLEETIEAIEIELLAKPQNQLFATIQRLKREMVFIRKAITPLREVLLAVQRSESPLLDQHTQLFFRDVFDHTLRVLDTMDSYRDLINSMLDIYLSSVSNRMNEVMKVLTVFATIFIPLTFLVGVYGMNFEYMPELHWRWSYPLLWLVFFLVPAGLLSLFKRKGWL